MAKKKKQKKNVLWKLAPFVAPNVHEVTKGPGKKTLTVQNALAQGDGDGGSGDDPTKWFIAATIAIPLFGSKDKLDPLKNISGKTGNENNAAAIAMTTNLEAAPLCKHLGPFRWDSVEKDEIMKCTLVKDFTDLVIANII